MTLNEFKAWLEGFEAAFDNGYPSVEQWAAVKAKLGKVTEKTVVLPTKPLNWNDRVTMDQPLIARFGV